MNRTNANTDRRKLAPPKLAKKFLQWFLRDDLAEEVQGDLEEQFKDILATTSLFRAQISYWYQVCHYLRPFAMKKSKSTYTNPNHMAMFKHNFIITFRNFRRNKTTFLINLIGLPTGMACALLIYLWVNNELSVDRFYKNDDRLYQVMENVKQDNRIITRQTTSGPTAETLADEMPEVEYAATATTNHIGNYILSMNQKDVRAKGIYASEDYFNIFSYELLRGARDKVLSDKKSMVISQSLARRLFGTPENAMGQVVEWQHDKQYKVSGILKDIPVNASVHFDFILSFEGFRDDNQWVTTWDNTAPQTYVLLKEGVNIHQFNQKIANLVRTKTEGKINHRTLFLTHYSDTYLYDHYDNGVQSGGRIEYVRLFSIIALFILLIACINFMNLSTAKASGRMKEIGIKKAIGAGRKSLISQYLGESMIMAFLSLFIAVLMVVLLLPQFNLITGKQLTLHFGQKLVLSLLGITIITGLIAGSYPALYLSGFKPMSVLKGKMDASLGAVWARKGLVILQFIISVVLIVSVLVVFKQIKYVQNKNLGYNKDNILLLGKEGALNNDGKLETFLTEVKKLPGVIGASAIGHDLTGHNGGTYGVVWPGKDPDDKTEFERVAVDYDGIDLLGIEAKAGRTFSKDFGPTLRRSFSTRQPLNSWGSPTRLARR